MDEYAEAVYAGLAEKTITAEELAKRSVAELELASVLVDLVGQAKADVKYGWVKALRLLVDEEPELLYAHFATFAGMLHSENNIFQWEALHLLASLAAVDDENTLEAVLDDSFAPIEGQIMITAANGIKSAAQIVRARPRYAGRIARDVLRAENGGCESTECYEIVCGNPIKTFHTIHRWVSDPQLLTQFAGRYEDSSREPTRKAALK